MSPPRREIRVGDFANRSNSHTFDYKSRFGYPIRVRVLFAQQLGLIADSLSDRFMSPVPCTLNPVP
jgi:hypothetical protein